MQAADDHPGLVVWFQIKFCHPPVTLDNFGFTMFILLKLSQTWAGGHGWRDRGREGGNWNNSKAAWRHFPWKSVQWRSSPIWLSTIHSPVCFGTQHRLGQSKHCTPPKRYKIHCYPRYGTNTVHFGMNSPPRSQTGERSSRRSYDFEQRLV